MAIGGVAGALIGGAAAGITVGMGMGIGSAALQATEVTMGQYIAAGSATGAAKPAVKIVKAIPPTNIPADKAINAILFLY